VVDAPHTTPDIGGKLTHGVAEQLARNWWMLLLNGAALSRGRLRQAYAHAYAVALETGLRLRVWPYKPLRGRFMMAVSDQLAQLSARAKEAETRAAAAEGKAKADLEQDVSAARASAQAQADKLRETADAGRGKISVWWNDVQRSWTEHVGKIRENIDAKRAEHDVDRAERRAENAEDDASFAIDYAYAAIEEAEYAVLDATLARMEADELAAK
jgi:hypothetical protein